MHQHFGKYGRALDHTAFGGQISLQNGNATGFAVGIFRRTDDLRVPIDAVCDVFADGFSGNGHAIGVQQPLFG